MDEARMHHISHVKPAEICMAKMDVPRETSICFIKLWIILLKAESICFNRNCHCLRENPRTKGLQGKVS